MKPKENERKMPQLTKAPTGISGLDEVLLGGLPAGRPTLVCGAAGCGKTLLGMTFLVNGATRFGEAGVMVSFEETGQDLADNVASLGFDVPGLIAAKKLAIDHIHIERSEIAESGEYDLEGLFVRLGYLVDQIGAKRVVLDTLEALFSNLSNESTVRAELRRLFGWLKERGLTTIITGERGQDTLTRHGLEEYVSDCVIVLDNRVQDQITTRRLRIVKFRGSAHGTNEFPFLLDDQGITVVPLSSSGLDHKVSNDVVSTGILGLDAMLGPNGIYRGSSVLVSGVAGSGKTIIGASFADAACRRGERCMFFSFEEAAEQLIRNVGSAGVQLQQHVEAGLLRFETTRPTSFGFEMHLAHMQRELDRFRPSAVIVDPVTSFRGPDSEVNALLLRMLDMLKTRGVTTIFTSLTFSTERMAQSDFGLSSLMDSWISLADIESNGERNRGLYVLKSRGMSHSNQIREYLLTDQGVILIEAYIGVAGVLTGSARLAMDAQASLEAQQQREEIASRRREIANRRAATERQIAELHAEIEMQEAEVTRLIAQNERRERVLEADRAAMSVSRGVPMNGKDRSHPTGRKRHDAGAAV
ncbi:circadian clock protein KaiC [Telmatospirillum sp.]|uniref:circadian clock protein KaiC n=1 Tax=Telmatospirillum sp. TaxID=2079197 RepID=UPI002849364B|nr:circadian clock protein KaiC [Telmatospirillum sp.]MDR3436298.1 circadian clock protein KaiC [Telmatospirillum sp.]